MDIKVDRHCPTAIHLQIAHEIRDLILKGTIPDGGRLPPTRMLAQQLGINRSTIVRAYNNLWSEGLIEGHVGRGTIVQLGESPGETSISPYPWGTLFTPHPQTFDPEVRELLRLIGREGPISLAGGLPAPELYPLDPISEITDEVLSREGSGLLSWCAVEGYPPLRRLLAERMGTVSPSEILILSGSQQGLYLLAQTLVEPGDFVISEAPTFLGALQVFRAVGARLVGIPLDEAGMDLEPLENALSRTQPKFIYTLPTFQNPTGATMTLERRRRLLKLAYRYRVPIVEDDPYSLLRYEAEDLPSLKALDTRDHVIYLSTFSKILFPGLRVGWLAAPRLLIERLAARKQMIDMFTNSLAQAVIDQICRAGLLEGHLERVRREYRRRRDTMIIALKRHCPTLRFTKPAGGCYIWCRLPRGIPARVLLKEALDEGVSFLIGEVFYPDGRGQEWMRLNFTSQPPETLEEAAKRLGATIKQFKRKAPEDHVESETLTEPIV